MKKFIVYKITNKVNGKMYVGWTSASLEKRWSRHLSEVKSGTDYYFHRAIRKYGEQSFNKEIIEVMTTEAGAKKAEQLWIKEYNSFGKNGYNSTIGGDGTTGLKLSEETKRKISIANKGNKNLLGFKFSEESKIKMSKSHKGMKNHLGFKHSSQSKEKMSVPFKGKTWKVINGKRVWINV